MFLPALTAPNHMLSQIQFQARPRSHVIHNTQGPHRPPQHVWQVSVNIILEMIQTFTLRKQEEISLGLSNSPAVRLAP